MVRWPFTLCLIVGATTLALNVTSDDVSAQNIPGMPKEFDYYYFNTMAPAIGEPALQMRAQRPNGDDIDLKDFLGKWTLIEFGSYT